MSTPRRRSHLRPRAHLVLGATLALGACNTPSVPTEAGTQIISHGAIDDFDPEVRNELGRSVRRRVTTATDICPEGAAKLEVTVHTATGAAGLYLTQVDMNLLDAGGFVVTDGGRGRPFNLGRPDRAIMAMSYLVHCRRVEAWTTRAGSSRIEVQADGTVTSE